MSVRLPVDVYSPDQLSLQLQELRHLLAKRRDIAAQARVNGATQPYPALSFELQALLKANAVREDDLAGLEVLIKELEALRQKAPVVHLTMAALPNRNLARQLTVWFRDQIHPDTLLTFVMRRDIGGGLMLRAGSNVYDFSFRGQLLRHKDRISEIANSV